MEKDPLLKERSRELRRNAAPAERILWTRLRDRRFAGFKFRRQHVFGPFIVDFYCPEAALVVELDGETHLGREQPDRKRQDWLEAQGLQVLRFWNTDVYEDLEVVQESIWRACDARRGVRPLTPNPSRQRGEGSRKPLAPLGRGVGGEGK